MTIARRHLGDNRRSSESTVGQGRSIEFASCTRSRVFHPQCAYGATNRHLERLAGAAVALLGTNCEPPKQSEIDALPARATSVASIGASAIWCRGLGEQTKRYLPSHRSSGRKRLLAAIDCRSAKVATRLGRNGSRFWLLALRHGSGPEALVGRSRLR